MRKYPQLDPQIFRMWANIIVQPAQMCGGMSDRKALGAVSAYTLRHAVITDLIRRRLPILTVAQLADTSVAMIEKHYGHLVHDDAEEALASLFI